MEDAQGEAVEVGPSAGAVGLGEAYPASWTCLEKTREVERYSMICSHWCSAWSQISGAATAAK